MGTTLTGKNISTTYLGLLKTTDNAVIGSTAKRLTDGSGTDSPLYLSTSKLGIGVTPTEALTISSGNIQLSNDNKIQFGTSDVYISGTTSTDNIQLGIQGATKLTLHQTTGLTLAQYGSGSITGTVTQRLGVTSAGQVVEIPIGGGAVDGSGTAGKITKWTDSDTIGDSILSESGSTLSNTGIFRTSGGSAGSPAYAFTDATNTGMFIDGGNLKLSNAGVVGLYIDGNNDTLIEDNLKVNGTIITLSTAGGTGTFQTKQASGTNEAGGSLQLYGGRSTGTGVGGDIQFFITPAGSSGSSVNTPISVLHLEANDSSATFAGTITSSSGTLLLTNGSNTRGFATNGSGQLQISNAANSAGVLFLTDDSLTIGSVAGTGSHSLFAGTGTFAGNVTINKASNPTSLQIGSSLADDPFIVFQTDGNTMSMGIDRSDSNKFVISDNATLGTNNRLTIDTSGNSSFEGDVGMGKLTATKSGTAGVFNSGTTNVVASFTSTDGTGVIQLADSGGNVEIGAAGNDFVVQPAGGVAQLTVGSSSSTFAGNLSAKKLTSTDGILELDDNGTHNGIINVPASLRINIDSDNGSTGESFQVGHNATNIDGNNILFKVEETGNSTFAGNIEADVASGGGITIDSADVGTLKFRGGGGTNDWGFASTNLGAGDFGIYMSNAGGGDPISAGTAKLYFDNTGNVGIGTTSPNAKLDVNGAVVVSPNTDGKDTFTLTTNASNDGRLLIKSDTTTKVDIQANGASYFNGGNVGIGTNSPTSILQIKKSTLPRITLTKTGVLDWFIGNPSQGTSNNFTIGTNSGSNTEILTLDTSGNTTFAGDVALTGSGAKIISAISSDNDSSLFLSGAGSGKDTHIVFGGDRNLYLSKSSSATAVSEGTPVLTLGADSNATFAGDVTVTGGDLTLGTDAIASSVNSLGDILSLDVDSDMNGAVSANMQFKISGSEKMRINNTGVGIGTNSPATKFVVSNGGASGIEFQPEVVTDTNSISSYDRTASAYMNLWFDALMQQFLISGSEKMRLNATGLGIGTTAPSVPLEIVGAISAGGQLKVSSSTTNDALKDSRIVASHYTNAEEPMALIAGRSDSSTSRLLIGGGRNESNASTQIEFYTASNNTTTSGSERMRITSGGDVQLVGNTYLYANPSAGSTVIGSGFQLDSANNIMKLWTNNTERMRITSGGNVGIGTDSPTANTLQLTGKYLLLSDSQTKIGDNGIIGGGSADGNTRLEYYTGKSLLITQSGSERMRITSAGDVLLRGTYNPYTTSNRGNITMNGTASNIIAFTNGTAERVNMYADQTNFEINNVISGYIRFKTNNTERMRITSAGNVGIGTDSPDMNGWGANHTILGISTSTAGKSSQLNLRGNSNATADVMTGTIGFLDSSGTGAGATVGNITVKSDNNVSGRPGGYMGFYTNAGLNAAAPAVERMRILSGGDVLISKTASDYTSQGIELRDNGQLNVAGTVDEFNFYNTSAGAYRFFVNGAGTVFATSTSISAISDISLKENIKPLETGLEEVIKLQPRRFDWKNGDGKNIAGFVAQEVEEVLPDLVSDYKYNDEENKKSVKMGDMLPTLVKAIQEQQAMIEELKAEIDKLKKNK